MNLILASQSTTRRHILTSARLSFEAIMPRIDEQEITKSLIAEGANPRDIADTLAELKAQKISNKNPDALVLGCDQILTFNGKIYGKLVSKDDLAELLGQMVGQAHRLITANVVYQNGKPLWRHIGIVTMTLRDISQEQIMTYVEQNWQHIQYSAGGYQFERSPDMFSSVKGNWFDIMGLSIGPFVNFLNSQNLTSSYSTPKLAAVLGHPISHSRSPKLHGAWLKKNRISGDYLAIDTAPEYFEDTVKTLAEVGFEGFNVTIPHKEAALTLASTTSAIADQMGAANTLIINDDGQISADNTDGYGFMNNIRAAYPNWDCTSEPTLVLGAGGASRAILVSLINAGAPKIYLTNRTHDRAVRLAREFGDVIECVNWDQRNFYASKSDCIVNTTALGMTGQPELELDFSNIKPDTLVTDLVYTPLETELLYRAKKHGCRTVTGLGMLLHQGVPGFEAWFGVRPVVDEDLAQTVLG